MQHVFRALPAATLQLAIHYCSACELCTADELTCTNRVPIGEEDSPMNGMWLQGVIL